MQPPVALAVDDLGHAKGGHGRHLDAIWTLQGSHGPIFGHADHGPGRGTYSRLSSSQRQVTDRPMHPQPGVWIVSISSSQPTLPSNRAFVVQFRTQPSGAPLSWAGRVEHVVSHQMARFQSLEE